VIQLLSIVAALIAVVISFFSPTWAWVPIAVPDVLLYAFFLSAKARRLGPVPDLSHAANEMIRKFGHFYAMPMASRDFSGASSTLALAGVLVGVIGAFKGFWWGLGIAMVNYLAVGWLGRQFNPGNFLADERERQAHQEVINYLLNRQSASELDG